MPIPCKIEFFCGRPDVPPELEITEEPIRNVVVLLLVRSVANLFSKEL